MIACMNERLSKSRKFNATVETTARITTPRQHPLKRREKLSKLFWNTYSTSPTKEIISARQPLPAVRKGYYFHIFEFDR